MIPVLANMALLIELMRREDLPEVLTIEVASFAHPWTEEMFENALARADISQAWVARLPEAGTPPPIVGYICTWVVGDELHINNIAVAPRWRRRGIAGALLAATLEHGRVSGVSSAFLEVRASNIGAQALYRQFGFEPAGVRRRYYDHPVEDAVVMKRKNLGRR